jgi:nucleotide-binding universal stress UspA family protein
MSISIRNILCPTDFSDFADHALGYGVEFARRFGAVVHVHHSINMPVVSVAYEIGADMLAARSMAEAQGREWLARRVESLAQEGLRVETHLTTGTAFEDILTLARERGIDLIIMGTHGKGALERLLMGSVAERVVRKAPCPVLTVRRESAGHPGGLEKQSSNCVDTS